MSVAGHQVAERGGVATVPGNSDLAIARGGTARGGCDSDSGRRRSRRGGLSRSRGSFGSGLCGGGGGRSLGGGSSLRGAAGSLIGLGDTDARRGTRLAASGRATLGAPRQVLVMNLPVEVLVILAQVRERERGHGRRVERRCEQSECGDSKKIENFESHRVLGSDYHSS